MIYLLFALLSAEMALTVLLLFRTPLRGLVILGLDKIKQGRGPLVARTVAATMLVVFSSTLHAAINSLKRSKEGGLINPTEEVLMANSLLEACLMGFSLFLAMITDRVHYYVKELNVARDNLEAVTKLSQDFERRKTKEAVEEGKELMKDKPLQYESKKAKAS